VDTRRKSKEDIMPNFTRRTVALASLATLVTALAPKNRALAQKKYGPGVSDTEIKVGQTIAYSGPASAYGQIGQAEAAFFKMINDRGGINGRKIIFISVDDGYSPAEGGRADPPPGRAG
jgi:ABC-type branched-subunit amino acid transport system substrate-binding protein